MSGMHPLEARRLYAAAPLTIYGTTGDDWVSIEVRRHDLRIAVGDRVFHADARQVSSVRLHLLDGNDYVGPKMYHPVDVPVFIDAGPGDDHITGSQRNDTIYGGAGMDFIQDLAGDDVVHGGDGHDFIYDHTGNDLIFGDAGDDTMESAYTADAGDRNTVHGGNGNDQISSSAMSVYRVYGEGGNDSLFGGLAGSLLSGGDGADVLYAFARTTLMGGAGNDKLTGSDDADSMTGGLGHDRLDGGAGNDTMWGGEGNDILIGRTGRDELHGSSGHDHFFAADRQRDLIDGGSDADTSTGDSSDTLASIESRRA